MATKLCTLYATTTHYIQIFKNGSHWGYRLTEIDFEPGATTPLYPNKINGSVMGYKTSNEALDAAEFHIAQNAFQPLVPVWNRYALNVCSKSRKAELRDWMTWQNIYAYWFNQRHDADFCREKATRKELPQEAQDQFKPADYFLFFNEVI
jgi:hypothetical protein